MKPIVRKSLMIITHRDVLDIILSYIQSSSFRALGNEKYSFIAITPRSTLTRADSNYLGPIYESNRSVLKICVLDRNSWYHITLRKLYAIKIFTRSNNFLLRIFISPFEIIYLHAHFTVRITCSDTNAGKLMLIFKYYWTIRWQVNYCYYIGILHFICLYKK